MNDPTLNCADQQRRHEVRKQKRNGLDYLEVSDDQLKLTVYFIGPAPEGLTKDNVRITGGRRICGIQVVDVKICPQVDPELDNCIVVTVDKPGDFSTYKLCLVNLPDGHPFDPRYLCLDFTFKVNCPSELDCKVSPVCPPEQHEQPEINYLAKDYASFRKLILDRIAVLMPDWKERHVPDLGITLVELLAYAGDHLSYYQDAVGTEAYLQTARQRVSLRRHALLVDYYMHEGCNARAWVHLKTDTDTSLHPDQITFITGYNEAFPFTGRLLTWSDLDDIPPGSFEVFEPLTANQGDIRVYAAHNEIRFYTWGDRECCLPKGATSATLIDGPPLPPAEEPPKDETCDDDYKQSPPESPPGPERELHLHVGDILIFEEVIGPQTANPNDADPARRHAVRLTRVEPAFDALYRQPVLEIAWADEDALPFPFCISAVGPPPDCAPIDDISVARGNVVLVDHGRRLDQAEDLGRVPIDRSEQVCEKGGLPSDVTLRPGRYRPRLQKHPLTFSQPVPWSAPASAALDQDPRYAVPWIRLTSRSGPEPVQVLQWWAQRDLLSSGSEDPHFVVEIDDRGFAHLRFGDGELGRLPTADSAFEAVYRVGNGVAGNVGAEAISHIVSEEILSGISIEPRNPLPARGGTAPETVDKVKLFAPHAFRHDLQRAITPDDYAALVARDFSDSVQRVTAVFRWTGSWYEVLVAVDARGVSKPGKDLLKEILGRLYRYRRIGHDLVVRPAQLVPLDIAMIICVKEGFLRGHVKAALQDRFSNRLLPDGSRGFFHPDNLSFGEGIHLSRLVAATQAIPGVESVNLTKLERLFEGPNQEIENGLLPLGPLEIARLDNDPSFPEHGRIQFDLRAGR